MSQASLSIVTGVLSGVVTALLVWLAAQLFRRVLLPWYRDHVYSGVEIAGTWRNSMELEGTVQHLQADLKQHGHTISGTVTITKDVPKAKVSVTLISRLHGELRDRLLVASLTPVDKARLGPVSLLLEVVGGGNVLLGCMSWYDSADASVRSAAAQWHREGAPTVDREHLQS